MPYADPHVMDDGLYLLVSIVFSLAIGLSLGSFATMLTWRLPRDLPIAFSSPKTDQKDDRDKAGAVERSRCTSCNAQLGLRDLVPFFSWVFLRGKCGHCGAAIPVVYPLVELGTALFCAATFLVFGWQVELIVIWALAPVLSAIIAIDQQHQIIPNRLNGAVALLGLAHIPVYALQTNAHMSQIEGMMMQAALGGAFFGLLAWIIRFIFTRVFRREAMGLGDVKFFAAAGIWLGPMALPWFMALSGLTGTLLGIVPRIMPKMGEHGKREIPFGPALVFSFIMMLLLPDWFQLPLADY